MLRSWGSAPAVRKLLYFFTDVHSDIVDVELAVLAGNGDEATGRQHFINVRPARARANTRARQRDRERGRCVCFLTFALHNAGLRTDQFSR